MIVTLPSSTPIVMHLHKTLVLFPNRISSIHGLAIEVNARVTRDMVSLHFIGGNSVTRLLKLINRESRLYLAK